jgi:outer membrane autotransporter protein
VKKILISVAVATAVAGWAAPSFAREADALPSVVGAEGVLNGVDTAGIGTLSVGANQSINTNNDAGGAITSTAADTAIVTFAGNSTVTGFSGTTGAELKRVDAGANSSVVNFNGAVFAQTFNVTGTGIVNFNGDVRAAALFAADGFITLGAGRTLNGAITTFAANAGTLTLNGGSNVLGAIGGASGIKMINVVGGNASVNGAVQSQGFNLGLNTLNIVGQLTTNAGGSIATTIASNTVFGQVIAGNGQINAGGITVTPTVTGALTNGTTFNIVSAGAGTNGAPVNVINASPRYQFSGLPTTLGNVTLLLTAAPLATLSTDSGALSVAPILDVNAANGSDLLAIQNAIAVLPNAASINNALKQLAPGASNLAAPLAAAQTTQLFQDLWLARMDETQNTCCDNICTPHDSQQTQTVSQKCNFQDQRGAWWGKGFGSAGNQDNVANTTGYNVKAYGAMLAYDMPFNDSTRVGFGGGYANTAVDGNDGTGRTKIDSYQLMAYFDHAAGPVFVEGSLMASANKYDGSRSIVFPGINRVANASFNGQQYTALVAAGKHFEFNRTVITPLASLQLSHIAVGSYQETGAGDASLRVNNQNYDFIQSGFGVKAEHLIKAGANTISPEIHVKWLHDFKATTMQQDASFVGGGGTFSASGVRQDRDLYNVGAGISLLTCNCEKNAWTVKGLYDYKWNQSGYSANQVSVIASMKF